MVNRPRALVLGGYGINTDREVARGLRLAGSLPTRVHLKDIIAGREKLDKYHLLVLPGGFSFGDDIAAGKILATKMTLNLKSELTKFVQEGKLILGICNGFQVLVKTGLLPDTSSWQQKSTLATNDSGRFEDRWVYLSVNPDSPCVFTSGIKGLYLPVRNGEGKFIPALGTLEELEKNEQIVITYVDESGEPAGYPHNPSGSTANVAGICNKSGRVFGSMPHPEAYLYSVNHPRWTREEKLQSYGEGIKIFQNAVNFITEKLMTT